MSNPLASSASSPSSSLIVGKGITGIGYLVFLTGVQRLSTFVLNQLVLRHLDPALLGLASLHFDLYLATALFLSREGFRLALSRDQPGLTRQSQSTTWLVLPLGSLVSFVLLFLFFHSPPAALPAQYLPDYHVALYLYVLAAHVELLAEPAYVYAHSLMLYRVRAMVEGVGVALRSVLTLVLIGSGDSALGGPKAFAVAQLVYAVALLVGYYGYFWRREGWEKGVKRLGISWQRYLRALKSLRV